MIRAGVAKSATALCSALHAGSIREFFVALARAKAAPKLDLGGFVAGDFHADADFDNHGSRPGHFFLRSGLSTALPAYMACRARRFKLGAAFNMIVGASQMGCGARRIRLYKHAEIGGVGSNANDAAERLDRRLDGC
jgi:hypothetical protein